MTDAIFQCLFVFRNNDSLNGAVHCKPSGSQGVHGTVLLLQTVLSIETNAYGKSVKMLLDFSMLVLNVFFRNDNNERPPQAPAIHPNVMHAKSPRDRGQQREKR